MIVIDVNKAEQVTIDWFGELGYDSLMAHDEATQAWDAVFGLPPRISIGCSPNLDLSSPNLSSSSSVLPSNSYDLKEAIP